MSEQRFAMDEVATKIKQAVSVMANFTPGTGRMLWERQAEGGKIDSVSWCEGETSSQ